MPTLDEESPRPSPSGRPPSSFAAGGYAPGSVLAERYRIIGLLGHGGMGEVYRADDLKLGQPVALKFLRRSLAQDVAYLERFHAEVRNARQVSHPNVCRVYDIGEADGHHFLSMEYVDGEDLATLLKRIGRLPADKALQIARQLCAGLAAAHDKGLLHRDLKPANVMLDGHGRGRITDFGLAIPTAEAAAPGELAGTPAYMAPEQIDGRATTVQSDLYSLGLVLYEVFTGKKVFEASSLAEWKRKHSSEAPTPPSSHASDMDPGVERAILRCLEKNPAKRPASALQLAAALPGGDPLAAALAAGETPSPEMVAAAGEAGALAPARAWALLFSVIVALTAALWLARYATLTGLAPIEKSPQVLAERAQEIVRQAGYTEPPVDSAHWLTSNDDFLEYRAKHLPSPQRVRELGAAEQTGYLFIYRQSPRPMLVQTPDWFIWLSGGVVGRREPPYDVSGMVTVMLDTRGRLIEFLSVAPQFDDSKGPWPAPHWNSFFAEAGLDPARFAPAQSKWWSPAPSDTLMAWDGSSAEHPETSLHVSAAAYRGKPVFFAVLGPWTTPLRMGPFRGGRVLNFIIWAIVLLSFASLGAGFFFTRRNLRLGRGDPKGAFRLSGLVFAGNLLAWALRAHHTGDPATVFFSFLMGASMALFQAGAVWLLYMALEPYVRRRWPEMLISWTRLLAGRVRDPLVGRDVLVGMLVGAAFATSLLAANALPAGFNVPGLIPLPAHRLALGGPLDLLSLSLTFLVTALAIALGDPFVLFLWRVVLRRQWPAIAATGLFQLVSTAVLLLGLGLDPENLRLFLPVAMLLVGLRFFLLLRCGLLADVISFLPLLFLIAYPLTMDFSSWLAGASSFALLLCLGLAFYGFRTALAGQPVFGRAALED
ncbi:MAG: serine/threonine-protein kinase [Candidatus Acidiferrales bacterium]